MVPTQQSKQNVLVVLGSGRWGGGEKNCVDLISGLRNYYNFVLIHISGKSINHVLKHKEIKHYEFPLNETPTPKKIFDFIKLVKSFKPDLIHSHLNRANLYLSLAKPCLKCTWISTVHGFTSQIYNIFPNHLICVSKAIQNDLPKRFRRKSTLIYNGIKQINLDTNHSISRQNQSDSNKNIKAIVLATIHPNKGQQFVCEALKHYESKVAIEFIGTGSQENTMKLLELSKKLPNVQFKNNIVSNIQTLLHETDFVIIPSFKEALSYVAIESLSLGVPILASRTGGLPEVAKEGFHGHFFTPGDIVSFQQGLEDMVSDHEVLRQNLKMQPFLENNKQFTEKHMTEKIHQLYKKLILNGPRKLTEAME